LHYENMSQMIGHSHPSCSSDIVQIPTYKESDRHRHDKRATVEVMESEQGSEPVGMSELVFSLINLLRQILNRLDSVFAVGYQGRG